MKQTRILMILLMLSIPIISGCSSNMRDFRGGQYRLQKLTDEERQRMLERNMGNLTEEGRQQLFEDRQQKAIKSCQEKNEGDSCILESPRGEIEGSCKIQNENLVCLTERPVR